MTLSLGRNLSIRAMVYVAAEQIPFFWPMRSFIHHNPLHGLEHLPFHEAVVKGEALFHAGGFLARSAYQDYLSAGAVDLAAVQKSIAGFVADQTCSLPIDLQQMLLIELTQQKHPTFEPLSLAEIEDVYQVLQGGVLSSALTSDDQALKDQLKQRLLQGKPVYEAIDSLYRTEIGEEVDEGVIRACLDFFDEGQSVWHMPNRDQGFFQAWLHVAGEAVNQCLVKLSETSVPLPAEEPEAVIARILTELGVPEDQWVLYITQEMTRLHGWTGFIRWRSNAKQYYWQQQFPGDLVDYLAIRLLLSVSLLRKRTRRGIPKTVAELAALIEEKPREVFLRLRLYGDVGCPDMAQQVEQALLSGSQRKIDLVFEGYYQKLRHKEARLQAQRFIELAQKLPLETTLEKLSQQDFACLYAVMQSFRHNEGMIWLRAMEYTATRQLFQGLSLQPPAPRDKRPFAKALFCIDTRSERIRRHLESIGDYQTYGIAGFFGVPVSFMELGKGSENHLCPVLLTPKNLVIEMTSELPRDTAALTAMEKAMHELKESVLTPFVTVEAIGLLFGFDMIGKTLLPSSYNRWRQHLHESKPSTHLMIDKLGRDQADSIVRAAQRAVIVKAVSQEFNLESELITDSMVRELREAALRHEAECPEFALQLGLDASMVDSFIQRLRSAYRINQSFTQLQLERVGRIGFSLEEQTRFVLLALQSIGLHEEFSRFILLVGHGSSSENNPYESALDCGACGGSHGLVSARVIAQMANKAEVRQRLRAKGIDIPRDAWFIPAFHNTTTDDIELHDLALLPPTHLVYLDRLRKGLVTAARLCAQERLPTLQDQPVSYDASEALHGTRRNAMDWSQVRPEWGLSGNAYFVIGRRSLTQQRSLDGRAFLHSYDYRLDPKRRLLENILTGPLVVGQWINMEHYFSTVDNERFGSGSKVYHNVAGRFGVMTGNYSDLRTGLPSQTVLKGGKPYHQPMRLITVIEAPFSMATSAIDNVVAIKRLVRNEWIRVLIIDPETSTVYLYEEGEWHQQSFDENSDEPIFQELFSA